MRIGAVRAELHAIGDEYHFTSNAHVAHIKVQQRSVLFDGRHTDDSEIDLELCDEIDGRSADHRAVRSTHGGPRDDHLNSRMAVEGHCDIQVVCDDEQVSRPASARDLLDGRPDVDDERRIVRNDFCGRDADGTLFILRDQATRLIGGILDSGKHNGVAMDPRQQPHLAQLVEIFANGLRRDLKPWGQVIHVDPAPQARCFEDFLLARRYLTVHLVAVTSPSITLSANALKPVFVV
jgi:hypothetical protein